MITTQRYRLPSLLRPKIRRLLARERMTIALAAKCLGGACLYADRLIMAGATMSEQCKIWYRDLPSGASVGLAVATSDFDAANAFAEQLLDGLTGAKNLDTVNKIRNHVESHLLTWSEPYHTGELPLDSYFLLAIAVSADVHLFYVQPRHTILAIPHSRAVGIGEAVAKPLLDGLLPESAPTSPEIALFRLAYIAKRTKEQSIGHSGSNAIFVPTTGPIRTLKELELKFAEDMTDGLDETAYNILQFLMGLDSAEKNKLVANHWTKVMEDMANLLREHVRFTDL